MRRIVWTAAVFLLLVGGAACMNINPTATLALPTNTLVPLATLTPRYTATPIPSASPRPTFTYTPTDTAIPPTPSDTPTPSPTPPVIGRVASVQAAVNMRAGPGTSFAVIRGVPSNTDVIVLATDESRRWYNIRLEDGTEGWMAADLISIPPSPTPTASDTPPGVVLEVSGTPIATSLLGGQPITATPSDTATATLGRTPGTLTATPTFSQTAVPGGDIPIVTPIPALMSTATASPTQATVLPPTSGFDVLAYCEQFNEVPPPLAAGTSIDVFWGWIATTPEYIQQHLDTVTYEVLIDGRLLGNWRQYATRVRERADGDWEIYWYVPAGELGRGTHRITYRVSWSAPITDGYRWFGPGTQTEFETGSCTFEIR